MMKTIVIAVDGSPASDEAMQLGLELAAEQHAEVAFVHVAPLYDVFATSGFGMTGALPHEVSTYDRTLLDRATQAAELVGVRSRTELHQGDTVDEIVASADADDADLIVIGSRGHGTIATTLLGSVSRGVLHETRRPVLVVRSPEVHELAVTAGESDQRLP